MSDVTIKRIHEDLLALRKEVQELKECLHEDFLELSPEVIKAVQESRQRMKKESVSHEEIKKEFE